MLRQLTLAVAPLIFSSVLFADNTNEERNDRYTTIHTVIRVGEDIDQLLDEQDRAYWSTPTERPLDQIETPEQPAAGLSLQGIEVSADELRRIAVSSESPFAMSEATLRRVFESRSPSALARADKPEMLSITAIELPELTLEELAANFQVIESITSEPSFNAKGLQLVNATDWLPETTDFDLATFRAERGIVSPSDRRISDSLASMQRDTPSISAAPPVIAAIPPRSSTAQTAGLWFFLAVMIAPFAWLGWQEYQDLQGRIRRVEAEADFGVEDELRVEEISAAVEEELVVEGAEEVTMQATLEEAEMQGELEIDELPAVEEDTAASADADDYEYELGLLEDANALLATSGGARRQLEEEAEQDLEGLSEGVSESDEVSSEAPLKETGSVTKDGGDLTRLRGVGPSTRDYLVKKGIRNLEELENAGEDRVRELLAEAGGRYQAAKPDQWITQAREILSASCEAI